MSLPARVKAIIAANGGHSRFLRARSVKVIGMDYSIFYFFPTHWTCLSASNCYFNFAAFMTFLLLIFCSYSHSSNRGFVMYLCKKKNMVESSLTTCIFEVEYW